MQLLVNIDVEDIDKAVDFYTRGLDLSLAHRLFDGTVAEMKGASCRIFLVQHPEGGRAVETVDVVRHYDRHWTPIHLDFEVEDIEAARARAIHAGAKAEGEIRLFAWGKLAVMSDPFGHGFCLIQFSDRGYEAAR